MFPFQYKYCTLKAECSPCIAPNKCPHELYNFQTSKGLSDPKKSHAFPCLVAIQNQNQGTIMMIFVGFVPRHEIEALWTSAHRPGSIWAYMLESVPSGSIYIYISSRLHVDIFQFWCFHSFEVHSINSSKMIRNSSEVSNFNRLFLELNQFICN